MTDIRVLYQAVGRLENHLATKSLLLDYLAAGHRNAPHGSRLRARLAREIDREVAEIATLKGERNTLRQQIADMRAEAARRGLRECSVCQVYKNPAEFSPELRTVSGLQAQCRTCRAAWLRDYRKRTK